MQQRDEAKRVVDEIKEEMDQRGGKVNSRSYGKVRKAEAAAKKRYEQACAEAGAAEEMAESVPTEASASQGRI